ncbi:MAG: C39 family peptidase [Candidatus Rokubacteria bacterium]|nr:C39 family peptidase [Candidatus Rokubacteria bacterium]
MRTDLFAVASGLAAVSASIPPACRRGVEAPPPPGRDGDDVVVEFPAWQPRRAARHLVPSLAVLSPAAPTFRFELSARAGGAWSPWVATVTIGRAELPPAPMTAGPLTADEDYWKASAPVEVVRLRLRLRAGDADQVLAAPWLLTLSACDLEPPAPPAVVGDRVRLDVPAWSQTEVRADIAMRICSPASVAMVLAYLGAPAPLEQLAAEMYHPGRDRYGVWPAAIAAAARRGVLGYLARFPDWGAAAWCLAQGLPVIASVRYAAGELGGAAIPASAGHLLVLTGYEGGDVLVNDPAAPGGAVARRYRLDELARVWLERAGVGYVLFRPA